MHFSEKNFEKLLGIYPSVSRKKEVDSLDKYFINPIIHREIHGEKVYYQLDLQRIWNQIG